MKREIETKFYHIDQNNSGGFFDVDENVCQNVIVEAINIDHAKMLLEKLTENGSGSCSCCGERWSIWNIDEDSIIDIDTWKPYQGCFDKNPLAIIHFLDGSKRMINAEE